MVPNGWSQASLDKIAKVIDCKHRTPIYVEDGIPLVSPGTIKWGPIDLDSPSKRVIPEEHELLMDHCKVQVGDLVMSRNQSVGVASYINTDRPFVLGQDTVLIQPLKAESKFLFYSLQSLDTQRKIFKLAGGSTFSRINLADIRKLKVNFPKYPEQQKIAQILSTWDKAIEKLEALIAAKQKRKKALMQQLLTGKKRFAGFEGELKEMNLEHLFKRITRKNTEGNTNVVTISAQKGLIKQEEFFNKTVASETLDNYFLLKQGEFAYNKSYSNGYPMGAIKRLNYFDKAVVTTLYICFAIKDNNKSCSNFFEHYFESGRLISGLMKVANEGGRAHGLLNVTPKDFFNLKIRVPDFQEQQKIASVLSAADTEIQTHQKQLSTLKQQKKGLMQQLLTGKKRVKVEAHV